MITDSITAALIGIKAAITGWFTRRAERRWRPTPMSDEYTPMQALDTSVTIFNYELKRLSKNRNFPDLYEPPTRGIWIVFGFIASMGCVGCSLFLACTTFYQRCTPPVWSLEDPLALIFTVLPICLALIVSLYTSSTTISFWQARAQPEALDLMRLTMPTDAQTVQTLQAVAELNVWRWMRRETLVRTVHGLVATAIIGYMVLPTLLRIRNLPSLLLFSIFVACVAWLAAWLRLYIREPLWRMRTLVALSIAVASRPSSNPTLIGASGALGLLMAQVTTIVAVSLITFLIVYMDSSGWYILAWLVTGSLLTTRIGRGMYSGLHGWYTWQTLRTMQGM